jgi:hypothetical protein
MPDLDLSWPSPELAQESAAILAELDLPAADRGHDEDSNSPLPVDDDDR